MDIQSSLVRAGPVAMGEFRQAAARWLRRCGEHSAAWCARLWAAAADGIGRAAHRLACTASRLTKTKRIGPLATPAVGPTLAEALQRCTKWCAIRARLISVVTARLCAVAASWLAWGGRRCVVYARAWHNTMSAVAMCEDLSRQRGGLDAAARRKVIAELTRGS
jgi:hypothetical protein